MLLLRAVGVEEEGKVFRRRSNRSLCYQSEFCSGSMPDLPDDKANVSRGGSWYRPVEESGAACEGEKEQRKIEKTKK